MIRNPFVKHTRRQGLSTQAIDVESRIDMVKNFSHKQCEDAKHVVGLQATVMVAITRRIKQLDKQEQ